MEFRVQFENRPEQVIDSSFPSLAARVVAENLDLDGDRTCTVMEPDGTVTHWKVSCVAFWYARSLVKGDDS